MSLVIEDGIGLIKCFNFITDLVIASNPSSIDHSQLFTSKLRSLLSHTEADKPSRFSQTELDTILSESAISHSDLESKITDKQLLSQVKTMIQLRSAIGKSANPKSFLEETFPVILRTMTLYRKLFVDDIIFSTCGRSIQECQG